MLNGKILRTQMPRLKAQYCTFSNSWIDDFLRILRKSKMNYFSKAFLNGFFKLKVVFLLNHCHSKVEKSGGQTMTQNTRNLFFLCINSKALNWGGGVGCFILRENFATTFLGNYNINYRQLCLYCTGTFFNLNEKTVLKKGCFSFHF